MAGSLFDGLQITVVNTVNALYGQPATWTPANGGPTLSGTVLYKCPTSEETGYAGGQVGYTEPQWSMEYFEGTFPGLKDQVDAALVVETVVIDGTAYHVRSVTLDFDGKTYKAQLNPASDD